MKIAMRRVLARPVGILVACSAILIMGALSFVNIPLEMLPSGFESKHITVFARMRDSSPAEAERHVAIPIEEGLGSVAGIESVSTRATREQVRISLKLKPEADAAIVERDVRDRVARVEPDLPEDVITVRVRREGATDRPVLFFSVTAKMAAESPTKRRIQLSDFMEDVVRPSVEAVDGVARMGAWGLLSRSVRIRIDSEAVSRLQIDLRDLLKRLRGDNMSSDLGDVREGNRKAFLRAGMEFESLEELRDFPVLRGVRLRDIAEVKIVAGLDQGWSRFNGNEVIVGTVYQAAGENTVDICRRVNAAFETIKAEHPDIDELRFRPFFDQGAVIENSLGTLYENALIGGVLAFFVMYAFFRRLRMTLLVTAAIPLSLTIAITALYLGGDTLNLATLMGMTLAVGMLIDSAIVVVEAIVRRRELGDEPAEAAAAGTGEVALAVVTATLTTIAVFLPAIFLSGDDSSVWLLSIGKPIGYSLMGSLLIALVLVPLGSIYLRRDKHSIKPSQAEIDAAANPKPGYYERALRWALHHRFATVMMGFAVFFSGFIPFGTIGRRGSRDGERGPVRVTLRFPRHYSMADADAAIQQYEKFVMGAKDELEVEGIFCRFDKNGGMAMMWKRSGSTKPKPEIREAIQKGWPRIPGISTSLDSAGEQGSTRVTLEGEDADVLDRTMDGIENLLKLHPLVAETTRERDQGLQELRVSVDPEAVERGRAVPDTIRGMIGWVLRGARLSDYRGSGRDLPLLLELNAESDVQASDLGGLLIPTGDGMHPLGNLAKMSYARAPSAIERRDGRRVTELQVLGNSEDAREFHAAVSGVLKRVKLPAGVRFQVGGSWRELQSSFDTLWLSFAMALCLVFLLTGVLFEAILLPFSVILSVPPAFAGAFWALYFTGKARSCWSASWSTTASCWWTACNSGAAPVCRCDRPCSPRAATACARLR